MDLSVICQAIAKAKGETETMSKHTPDRGPAESQQDCYVQRCLDQETDPLIAPDMLAALEAASELIPKE